MSAPQKVTQHFTAGDSRPAFEIANSNNSPALRIHQEGAGNAIEIVDSAGNLLSVVNKNGGGIGDENLPGLIVPTGNGWSWSLTTPTANRAYAVRFVPKRAYSITLAALGVNVAATTDDPIDVGVYDANGNRIVSTGSLTGKVNSTGSKPIPLVLSLVPGAVYYSGIAYGPVGGVAASVSAATFATLWMEQSFGTAPPLTLGMFKDSAFPLPATLAGFSTGAATLASLTALRES